MTASGAPDGRLRPREAPAFLAAALLAATALVGVPVQIYRAAALDFASASRDVLLAVFASGLVLFALLAVAVTLLPAGLRRGAGLLLVALAGYAWTRSGFFPGPSVNLDGSAVTADLSTGWAGLLVPVAAGALLAGLGARRPRDASVVLAVLVAGSLVPALVAAASTRGTKRPGAADAVASLQEWSRSGNVLVIVLDSLQSDVFEDALRAEPGLRVALDGFRHYRLASSSGPTTYLSLPTIHGGRLYEPGRSAVQFYREAVYEGSVLNRLAAAGHRTSYAVSIGDCPKAVASCTGTAELARSRVEVVVGEASPLLDLGVYRVLPDALRVAVLRQGRGPVALLTGRASFERPVVEAAALQRLSSASTVTDSPPTGKMIHSMVTHLPAVLRPDCSTGERRFDREAAGLQARCAFRRIVTLLGRLRTDGVYDVSSIAIVADHGYGFESTYAAESEDPKFRRMVGAFNPTVLVKPARAHGPLTTSDAPIELADVTRALCGEGGCSPDEGLRGLDAIDAGRARTAFWYTWNHAYWNRPGIPGLARYAIRGDLPRVGSWSREGEPYEPGTPIEFRRGGNVGSYAGFGWGHREQDRTRMADAEATVWLRGRFERSRDYSLVVVASLPGATPVSVEVNGVEVGELVSGTLEAPFDTYRFAVPASVLSKSTDTVVRFSARHAGAHGDRPEARLALRTIQLDPAP